MDPRVSLVFLPRVQAFNILGRNERFKRHRQPELAHIWHNRNLSSLHPFPLERAFRIFAHWKIRCLGDVYIRRGRNHYGRTDLKKKIENTLGYYKTLLIMLWVFTPPNKKIGHKTKLSAQERLSLPSDMQLCWVWLDSKLCGGQCARLVGDGNPVGGP